MCLLYYAVHVKSQELLGLSTDAMSPLMMFHSGVYLTKSHFVSQTLLYLMSVGLDASLFSGHSYRAGSATSAALAGLSDWEIQLLGRWTSSAYQRYIRAPRDSLIKFAHRLVQHQDSTFPFRTAYVANII